MKTADFGKKNMDFRQKPWILAKTMDFAISVWFLSLKLENY